MPAARGGASPRGDAPKLLFIAGPREGEQFALTEHEVVIGRANDVTLPVADTSVSRRHLSLRRTGDGWVVKDLGSGNGTLVNGETIVEEVPLRHGDTVMIGETEFTFSDDGNVTGRVDVSSPRGRPSGESPARGTAPVGESRRTGSRPVSSRAARNTVDPAKAKKKRLTLIAAVLVVVAVGGGIAAIKLQQNRKAQLEQDARAQQAAALANLEGKMQEARNLVRQSKWKEAKVVLTELNAAAPNFQNVNDLLARAEVEIPNQERIGIVEEALKAGELARAHAAFGEISSDTAMFEKVAELKRALADRTRARLLEANDLIRDGKYTAARSIAEDALVAVPDSRDAQILIDQAKEGIEKGKVTPRVINTGEKAKPTEPAVAKFLEGDLTGAAALLNTCTDNRACKDMLRDVTEFGQLYKRLDDLDEKGLSQLLALDRKITGGQQSKLARIAGSKASGIYLRAAQTYKSTGRWDRVRLYVSRALQANPGLVEAKKLQAELEDRAKELYMQGYSQKDNDPDSAIEKFRDVLQMTDPNDELHGKAKNWLSKLGR